MISSFVNLKFDTDGRRSLARSLANWLIRPLARQLIHLVLGAFFAPSSSICPKRASERCATAKRARVDAWISKLARQTLEMCEWQLVKRWHLVRHLAHKSRLESPLRATIRSRISLRSCTNFQRRIIIMMMMISRFNHRISRQGHALPIELLLLFWARHSFRFALKLPAPNQINNLANNNNNTDCSFVLNRILASQLKVCYEVDDLEWARKQHLGGRLVSSSVTSPTWARNERFDNWLIGRQLCARCSHSES